AGHRVRRRRGGGGGPRRTHSARQADRGDPPRVRRDLVVGQGLLPASVRQARGVISALVLAAGEGTRFGGTKQLEILRGKPLVQYAVDAASAAAVGEI